MKQGRSFVSNKHEIQLNYKLLDVHLLHKNQGYQNYYVTDGLHSIFLQHWNLD